jgi:hypothetical protein
VHRDTSARALPRLDIHGVPATLVLDAASREVARLTGDGPTGHAGDAGLLDANGPAVVRVVRCRIGWMRGVMTRSARKG